MFWMLVVGCWAAVLVGFVAGLVLAGLGRHRTHDRMD
jgi:hypothetical protein